MSMSPSTFVSKLTDIPRFELAHLPTPLEELPIVTNGRRVFVKRDDCTGFALGGNKSRKLEYTLADAIQKQATVLLTASGIQSNHVRQCAAAAAKAGMGFHGIVAPALKRFPRSHLDNGNVLIDVLYGAKLHLVSEEADAIPRMLELADLLKQQGERPYIIPLGASDGLGSLGYARCAMELLEQFEMQNINPSHIFVPTGSGGTHGGLLAGLRGLGSNIIVQGISVSEPTDLKISKVKASIHGIEELLAFKISSLSSDDVRVNDRYTGGGYALPLASANEWIVNLARKTGLLLDPVYTGKAFAGMMDMLQTCASGGEGDIIFLHTGGTPALFADPLGISDPLREAPELAQLLGNSI